MVTRKERERKECEGGSLTERAGDEVEQGEDSREGRRYRGKRNWSWRKADLLRQDRLGTEKSDSCSGPVSY